MKLLYFSIISFFFIASSTLVLTTFPFKNEVIKSESSENFLKDDISLSPLPVFIGEDKQPDITSYSALAIDVDSGVYLFEKNPDAVLLPASTTKIVTALVAIDYYQPDNLLAVGQEIDVEGQKMKLVVGEEITVNDLLYGLLVYSANDAAEVLARNYPGGRDSFIKAMNLKAKVLNLDNTYFTNPTGLDGSTHVSSARDLVRASSYAMKNPLFSEIVGTKEKTVEGSNGKFIHKLTNINELLGSVEGVKGIKTGWTENARENLVTYVERNNKKVIISLLGSQDRFGETKKIIDYIFENYEWRTVQEPDFNSR